MKNHVLLLAFCAFFSLPKTTFGCMNEYWGLVNGKLHVGEESETFSKIPIGHNLKDNHIGLLFDEMEERYRKNPTIENYSDYAAAFVYKGKYQKAKKILLEIEQKKPNLYNTAANLGTVYELLGQNDSALIWIQKAVAINPQSHFDSEWIHVKILEAKIKASFDTAFFYKNNILGVDFGQETIPQNKNKLDLKNYATQLFYQLTERMSFVKPKDPIVAQLTFDLATLYMLQDRHFEAFNTFEKAKEYGFESQLLEERHKLSKKLSQEQRNLAVEEQMINFQKPQPVSQKNEDGLLQKLLLSIGLLILGFVGYMVWEKKQSRDF